MIYGLFIWQNNIVHGRLRDNNNYLRRKLNYLQRKLKPMKAGSPRITGLLISGHCTMRSKDTFSFGDDFVVNRY